MKALMTSLGICVAMALTVGGCGSDDEDDGGGSKGGTGGATGGSGGTGGGTGGATGGTAGSSTGGTAGSSTGGSAGSASGGSAGASAQSCDAFCAAVQAACTDANEQYADEAECQTACATWDPGTPGDTAGDTLACRIYHVGVAATPGMAGEHCPHAGPDGGGVCTD
jgi:hypothetical protein